MMYRLIALDIDGTLIRRDGHVSEENRRAIQEARSAGCTVVLATGRSWQEAADIAREARCDSAIVCLGGAGVADWAEERMLEHWTMADQSALEILELLQPQDLGLLAFADDRLIVNARCEAVFRAYPCRAFHETRILVPDVREYLRSEGLSVNKIFLLGKPDQLPALRQALTRWGDVYVTCSGPDNLELLRKGVDKGTGLTALARRLGIPMEDVLCIGDSDNDRGMLAAAGMPVVMGNAAPEIQALGRWITDTNERDGVAKAIRHFLSEN